MPVKTPVLTDASAQTATAYNANIDADFNVADRIAWAFAPHEQVTPDMTVRLEAGYIPAVGSLPLEVAAQSTGTITPPSANPRRDIVYIDATAGTVGVATGTEAASPADPDIPDGKVAVARINLATSQTTITNSDIDDLRCPPAVFVDPISLPLAVSSGGTGAQTAEDARANLGLEIGVDVVAVGSIHPGFDVPFLAGWDSEMDGEDLEVRTYGRVVLARSVTILDFVADDLGVAPTGAAVIVDIAKNGTTVFTTAPQFAAGATALTAGTLDASAVDCVAGDVIEFKVTQIGSTTPGQQLTAALKGQEA